MHFNSSSAGRTHLGCWNNAGTQARAGIGFTTNRFRAIFPMLAALGAVGLVHERAWAWKTILHGSAVDWDRANRLAIHGDGNIFAAGWIVNSGTFRDFTVVK